MVYPVLFLKALLMMTGVPFFLQARPHKLKGAKSADGTGLHASTTGSNHRIWIAAKGGPSGMSRYTYHTSLGSQDSLS